MLDQQQLSFCAWSSTGFKKASLALPNWSQHEKINKIMEIVDKEIFVVHAALLDFSKAFDKVSHSLLINRLCSSGISSLVIK